MQIREFSAEGKFRDIKMYRNNACVIIRQYHEAINPTAMCINIVYYDCAGPP